MDTVEVQPEGPVALVVGPRETTSTMGRALTYAGFRVVAANTGEPGAAVVADAFVRAGRLDVLVQHHPTVGRAMATDLDLTAWQQDLDTLTTTLVFAREFARVAEPGAAIVHLASIDLAQAYPLRSTASVASNGLVGLSRALAVEWATRPIRVNVVALGVTLSEADRTLATEDPAVLERTILRAPGHRLGELSEAASLVRFLVGQGAQFITGQTIWADGGWAALTQHAEGLTFP